MRGREPAAIEAKVEIARPFDGDRGHERRQRHAVGELLGDLARLAFERLRQLERDRRGEVAHVQLRRRLQHDAVDGVAEERERARLEGLDELLVNRFENHVWFQTFRIQ